jgi:predicted nucleotidyltransferase
MGITKRSSEQPASAIGGVADALFTKGQQRVLAVLFGNPERTFYATEIIALASAGSGAIQRELAKLERAGLVTVSRVGNQKHYQANRAAPVFAPLRELVLKTSGLADVLRSALKPIAGEIQAAFVYGSTAKRKDSATSDVDVLVVSDTLSYAELFAVLEKAARKLGRPVNPTLYSKDEFLKRARAGKSFIARVKSRPKIWLIGDEDAVAAR